MTVRRIFELRFADEEAFSDARAALAAEVPADASALDGHIDVARTEDGRVLVSVTAEDADALARGHDSVVDPWLSRCRLSGPVVCTDATLVWPTPNDGELMTDQDRIDRFVTAVTDAGTVWGLYGTTWARADVGEGVEALPFWPSRAEAARCIADDWAELVPRAIDLDVFVEQWLTGMVEDGIVVVVSPGPTRSGTWLDPAALIDALEARVGGEIEG